MWVALDLLGREIGWRADKTGGAGNLRGKAGDAEVAEFNLAIVGDKDVGRLDVAMKATSRWACTKTGGRAKCSLRCPRKARRCRV